VGRRANCPWVFVGRRGASLANNPARWTEILHNASGLDFTLHDLRRTCATGCARLGASESTVSRILGHRAIAGTIAVSGIYDRFDRLPEIRAALLAWSNYVEALVTGEEQRGEVLAFPRASVGSGLAKATASPAPTGFTLEARHAGTKLAAMDTATSATATAAMTAGSRAEVTTVRPCTRARAITNGSATDLLRRIFTNCGNFARISVALA